MWTWTWGTGAGAGHPQSRPNESSEAPLPLLTAHLDPRPADLLEPTATPQPTAHSHISPQPTGSAYRVLLVSGPQTTENREQQTTDNRENPFQTHFNFKPKHQTQQLAAPAAPGGTGTGGWWLVALVGGAPGVL
jgi:hypothetical protein